MQKYIIYGLKDPKTDDIMYVGKSTQGLDRPRQHLNGSHNQLVRDWVNSLNSENLEPEIIVLEEADSPNFLLEKEKFWMSKLTEEKHPLLNIILYNQHIDQWQSIKNIENQLAEKRANLESELDKLMNGESDGLIRDYKNLGHLIRKRRKLAGITQKGLADIAGVGKTCVFDAEHGKTTLQIDTLYKIMNVLNIEIIYLAKNFAKC